jgi:hypothetical protein
MDVLISYLVLLVCAVLGLLLALFKHLARAHDDGELQFGGWSAWFFWTLVGGVCLLAVTAFAIGANGAARFQNEFGFHSGVPPLAISAVAWYAVWTLGWGSGRSEGRQKEKTALWARRIDCDAKRREQYLKLCDLVREERVGDLMRLLQEMKALDDHLSGSA